jgi:hypothetical protein
MKKYNLFVVLILFLQLQLFAQKGEGGIWMPNTIKQVESDMQQMGMKLSADEIWDTSKPSIKDAVVIFDNGCTAEVMSDKGLLFTNHHCGYEAIQKLSSIEHNYLENGFWAKSQEEEMPAEGVTVVFIDDIIDVSEKILNGITESLSPSERKSLIDKNIAALNKETPQDRFHNIEIKPFFKGNKYYMVKKTTFYDIRLVGTPPASLGKFGGDTDNWMWPRHTADFSIFRIYANQNNEPATYAATNQPYKPKYSLKISLADLKEDDFTMVLGFPGRTTEYLTSYAVQQKQDLANPARVKVREITLGIMDKNMATDKALKLKLASRHARLANYWKFWIGETQGLKKFKAVAAKQAYEKEFMRRINKNPKLKKKYGQILPQLKELYTQLAPYVKVQNYASEIFNRNIDLPSIAGISGMLIDRSEAQGENYYNALKERYKDYIISTYLEGFDAKTDKEIFASLISLFVKNVDTKYIAPELREALKDKSPEALANDIYQHSILTTKENLDTLFAKNSLKEFTSALQKDAAYQLFNAQQKMIDKEVSEPVNKINAAIDVLMGKYMKAQMEVFKDREFYPDANFTMRVSYGRVKGYTPRDGVFYEPFTHLSGVIEKYKPNDLEFDLPKEIIDSYNKKEYGKYASKNGTLVTDFLATNHITGGNSGSPILNANGEHIGLAFDGVWEGVMEDVYYRPEIARSIHVKDSYVLFIIDKLYNAQYIMKELTIVK